MAKIKMEVRSGDRDVWTFVRVLDEMETTWIHQALVLSEEESAHSIPPTHVAIAYNDQTQYRYSVHKVEVCPTCEREL